jgi:hypothetical protein
MYVCMRNAITQPPILCILYTIQAPSRLAAKLVQLVERLPQDWEGASSNLGLGIFFLYNEVRDVSSNPGKGNFFYQ